MSNCLKTLRDAARELPLDNPLRERLLLTADRLQFAINDLWQNATVHNMTEVNGFWALSQRLMTMVKDATPPTGRGGAMPVPQQERKVA